MIKLKRGSYETLSTSNISIPYGQPIIGDADSGTLKFGQCGSVLTSREQEIPHFYKWWDELQT